MFHTWDSLQESHSPGPLQSWWPCPPLTSPSWRCSGWRRCFWTGTRTQYILWTLKRKVLKYKTLKEIIQCFTPLPNKCPATDLGFQAEVSLKYCFSSSTTTFPLTTILSSPDTVSSPMQTWYLPSSNYKLLITNGTSVLARVKKIIHHDFGTIGMTVPRKVSCSLRPVSGLM